MSALPSLASDECERLLARQQNRLEVLDRVSKLISQELDLDKVVQTVTDIATELSGAKFGAFFYNVRNAAGESYMLYTLSGAPKSSFERFGMPRNTAVFDHTFQGSGVVRSPDIRKDPRYGHNAPHHGMPKGHLPVVSYLAVPVTGRDREVLGGLFFGHDQAAYFTQETEEIVVTIAAHAAIAINNARLFRAVQEEVAVRKQAEAAKELLVNEVQHRVKNTLGIVQAIVSQTFKGAPVAEHKTFRARLKALAAAHDLLTERHWERAGVGEVARLALGAFEDHGQMQLVIQGPEVSLGAGKSLMLAMVLHELATNAVKYGALSQTDGRVEVTWTLDGNERLRIKWRESGGPSVSPPERKGFGSVLITKALASGNDKAEIAYLPEGVVCTLEMGL